MPDNKEEKVEETDLDRKFAEGSNAYLGQRMDNGAEGCCEAATKIGSYYSTFLASELEKGVVYCPTLVSDAGDLCIDFDESKLEKGDCIIYDESGDTNCHVVLFDGAGGYVGNSTGQMKVVHGSDFREMGGSLFPARMIKTGGKSSTKYIPSGDKGGGNSQTSAQCQVSMKGETAIVSVKPKGKTFCEPIHPDLIAVTGNIPKAMVSNIVKKTQLEQPKDNDTGIYNISLNKLEGMTGINFTGFFSDSETIAKSQQIFDPTKFKTEKKKATKGRPINNTDPYPIDQKIEELETHQPRIKLQEIKLPKAKPPDIENAKATLVVADHAEKRIVKLENMMSTLYRYLFGTGSRFMVNCVYFGGQSRFQKYKGIRCLRDDRIQDGGKMQLDQCLTCTRFEPLIGQTYEILDKEIRKPLNLVLDNLQMSYQGMANEIDGDRIDSFHNAPKKAVQNMSSIKIRDALERDFSQIQKPGYVQDWKLTPVETQKPSINWKQDINDSDKAKKHLASYQYANAGSSLGGYTGDGAGIAAGNMATIMEQNYKAMEAATDSSQVDYINQAKDYASEGRVQATIDNMNNYSYKDILVRIAQEANIDPLFLLSIAAQESSGTPMDGDGMFQVEGSGGNSSDIEGQIKAGADHILGNIDSIGSNPILISCAYNWGSGAAGGIDASADGLWTSMFDSIKSNAESNYPGQPHRIFYPASVVYLYISFKGSAGLTPLDQADNATSTTKNLRFPFEQRDYSNIVVAEKFDATITADGGAIVKNYNSYDINGSPVEIYAAGAGSVSEVNDDVITVNIPSSNLTFIYQGVSSEVKTGDDTDTSKKLGTVSSKLYLQIKDEYGTVQDPSIYFPFLSSLSEGDLLSYIQ